MEGALTSSLGPSSVGRVEITGPYDVPGLPIKRLVRIYTPTVLKGVEKRPSLFMFDGQNMFEDEPSFAGGWHMDQMVERLARRGFPVPVVIGIDHGGQSRLDELCPWLWGASEGKANVLIDWMVDKLLPDLRSQLSLDDRPEVTLVGGSSMGGLAALYAHFYRPDAFGGAMCISPAFWYANGRIFPELARKPLPKTSRIYIDCGALEGNGGMIIIAERVVALLHRRGYGPDRLLWKPDEHGDHRETHWRRRAPRAIRFLLPKERRTQRVRKHKAPTRIWRALLRGIN